MPYTDFHYVPTGTGVISGKEVLEQTEDAINDLGQQTAAGVDQAIDTANNAMNTANTAMADAQNAVNVANTAQTTATNAQNTANAAQTTATNAQNAATAAQNDVDALENVVTGIDGRLTTTEGNVTNLTTRMGTAEGNITTLQNDVLTAQGTATSAQNTATLAREQAYVVRYASVAVSDNSTVPYSNLNNTDNIKANDLLLDINGKIYQISAVDTSNETVSVATPLTQLAVDSDVLHNSGNETKTGNLTVTELNTTKINSLNPGSLSLPDLNNGIDISGYLTPGITSNTYTALADGYISVLTTSSINSAIYWSDSSGIIGGNSYAAVDIGGNDRITNITFPVNKGVTYVIVFKSVSNIVSAKFFPCLGNV